MNYSRQSVPTSHHHLHPVVPAAAHAARVLEHTHAARGAAPGPGTHNPPSEAVEIRLLDAALADPTLPAILVEGAGFEPAKAEPTDLQSAPFDRFGTPPQRKQRIVLVRQEAVKLPPSPWSQSRGLR